MNKSTKINQNKHQKAKLSQSKHAIINQTEHLTDLIEKNLSKTIPKVFQKEETQTSIKTEVQVKVQIQQKPKHPQHILKIQQNKTIFSNKEITNKNPNYQEQNVIQEVLKQAQDKKAQCQSKLLQKSNMLQGHYIIPESIVQSHNYHIQKQMKQEKSQKDIKDVTSQEQRSEYKENDEDINFSAEFQDLEETTESKTEKNEQKPKQKDDPNERHYIIPGTMFEGQFQYVTKEKKEQDVEEQLKNLQHQKRQLQISTQHYVNPTTIVEAQVSKGGKEQKKEYIEKQLQKLQEQEKDSETSENQKPKVMRRVNLHEFKSSQVPELHQQDIPMNFQPVQVNQNLYGAIQEPKIKTIKPFQPVSLNRSDLGNSEIPTLKPVSLTQPLLGSSKIETQKTLDQKPAQKQRHYIVPGTCFQGQFTYVTKEKKEEDVQRQLEQLDNEKRQLEISTEHYVVPTTTTTGQVQKAEKKKKQQMISKEVQSVLNPKPVSQNIQSNKAANRNNQFKKTDYSQSDTEGLKLLKEKSDDEKFIKMEISSNQEGMLPYKIDQFTAMTVISSTNQEERPSLTVPQSKQLNNDMQIIVIETSLNEQATSPRDLVNQRAKDVLKSQRMASLISGFNDKDGSPVKVVIGTKQFANYPGQSAPSPPIIDQQTLSQLRKKKNSEFLQTNTQTNQIMEVGIETRNSEEGNPEQIQVRRIDMKEKNTQIMNGDQKLEVEHLQVTLQFDKIKKVDQDDHKKRSFLPKLMKSAVFSTLIGGLAWLSLEDKKIAAISAASGLALALIVQI